MELHNYSPKNSFNQKLVNWETLNNKVLKKIKINLTKKRIEQLSRGDVGVIEKLLLEIKQKIDLKSAGDDVNSEVYYLEESPNKTMTTKKKVIPIAVFEKLQSDLDEKNEAIEILKNKVDHLENLLGIKEERIKDLNQQLQTIVNSATNRPEGFQQGTKFFSLF